MGHTGNHPTTRVTGTVVLDLLAPEPWALGLMSTRAYLATERGR